MYINFLDVILLYTGHQHVCNSLHSGMVYTHFNLLKPTGYVMHQQV